MIFMQIISMESLPEIFEKWLTERCVLDFL